MTDPNVEMRRALACWKRSGLSLREFARQEDISYHRLVYWKKRQALAEPAQEFVAVSVRDDGDPAGSPFEVRLASGVTIEVPADFRTEDLSRLIQAVRSC